MGLPFHHPFESVVLRIFSLEASNPALNERVEPQMDLRSLHMHTLHPIEGLQAFWMGGEGQLERAEQVIDWVVKNRGNDLQWVSLDDIMGAAVARDGLHTLKRGRVCAYRGLQLAWESGCLDRAICSKRSIYSTALVMRTPIDWK